MIKTFLFPPLLILCLQLYSQNVGIGISNPNQSALLDMSSNSKGLLIPRMTTAAITAINSPAKGLLVYDSIKNQLMVNMGTAIAANWQNSVAGSGWGLNGNSGTDPSTQFIGTTDNHPLLFRINNQWAGIIDSASTNTHIGYLGGKNTEPLVGYNTGLGYNHMRSNTKGFSNTAIGIYAMYANTTGHSNTAVGASAMYSNVSGTNNVATGSGALASNVTGSFNTASGTDALYANTSGIFPE
jgi:hypothetical protein